MRWYGTICVLHANVACPGRKIQNRRSQPIRLEVRVAFDQPGHAHVGSSPKINREVVIG